MAEYCLVCMNRIVLDGVAKPEEKDIKLRTDFCEGCAEWTLYVRKIKRKALRHMYEPKKKKNRTKHFRCSLKSTESALL